MRSTPGSTSCRWPSPTTARRSRRSTGGSGSPTARRSNESASPSPDGYGPTAWNGSRVGPATGWSPTPPARCMAWLEYPTQRPDRPELVVFDSDSRAVLDRQTIEVPDRGSASVLAVADRGVFVADVSRGFPEPDSLRRYDVDTGVLEPVDADDMAAARRAVSPALVVGPSAQDGRLLHWEGDAAAPTRSTRSRSTTTPSSTGSSTRTPARTSSSASLRATNPACCGSSSGSTTTGSRSSPATRRQPGTCSSVGSPKAGATSFSTGRPGRSSHSCRVTAAWAPNSR